ncbi:hypothetical protein GCM10007304_00490 [Rhodococcoides trifolii]|uniref:VOC domain-containing protein n=1 Tax=Rhodococcoides trifolii TaxID=908250 RepID=A0A917CJ94_9NOCA|nr:VOC family protein [Rhodococcus trifolii]GGF90507.1 hypothetical protein GCM10007304_00490 [Rhodococcus trifolii]
MHPQPMIAVSDIDASRSWYRVTLGLVSGHGGHDYEQLLFDATMVLQLHRLDETHHHEPIGAAGTPLGNGVALWFAAADFDQATDRIRAADPVVVTEAHHNPNAGHREIWIRDPDGYLVVVAGT